VIRLEAPDADRYQLFSEYGAKSFVKPVAASEPVG
jgi:hypothetical protein